MTVQPNRSLHIASATPRLPNALFQAQCAGWFRPFAEKITHAISATMFMLEPIAPTTARIPSVHHGAAIHIRRKLIVAAPLPERWVDLNHEHNERERLEREARRGAKAELSFPAASHVAHKVYASPTGSRSGV